MPLSSSRKTPKLGQDTVVAFPQSQGIGLGGSTTIYVGAVANVAQTGTNAGYAVSAATPGPGLVPVGINQPSNPNTAIDAINTSATPATTPSINGIWSQYVTPRAGEFLMNNGTNAWDIIAQQHIGQTCFQVDDATVALNSAFGSRSPLGVVCEVLQQTMTLPGGVMVQLAPGIAQLHNQNLIEFGIAAAATAATGIAEQQIGRTMAGRVINGFSFTPSTAMGAGSIDATLQSYAKFQLGYRTNAAPGTLVVIGEVVLSGTTTAAFAGLAAFAPSGLLAGVPAYGPCTSGASYFGTQTVAAAVAGTGYGLGTITGQVAPFVPAGSVLTLTLLKGTTGLATPAGTVSVF